MKYSSSFTHDLNFGEKAEDWINELFSNGKHIDVKNDRLIHKTGNLFIEYESRDKPSGLATTTAEYWIYRLSELDSALIFPTKSLKQVCRGYYKQNIFLKNGGDSNTSKGFLIPLTRLLNDIANERSRELAACENDIPRHKTRNHI
jgi:hypothetical protein